MSAVVHSSALVPYLGQGQSMHIMFRLQLNSHVHMSAHQTYVLQEGIALDSQPQQCMHAMELAEH